MKKPQFMSMIFSPPTQDLKAQTIINSLKIFELNPSTTSRGWWKFHPSHRQST